VGEGESVFVVRITPGPRMAVASVLSESKLFCETPMQVSLGVFFTHQLNFHQLNRASLLPGPYKS